MPLIPAFGRLRQEDLEFEANLSYIVSVSKKKKKTTPQPKVETRY
jgi:hypothetical protein